MLARLRELSQIAAMRKLDRNETAEFNRLQAENQRIEHQANVDANWRKLFSITVPGNDGPLKLVDHAANRQLLWRWAEDSPVPIKDVEAWFKETVQSPQARAQLSWEPYLNVFGQKKQHVEEQERLREQALAKCRQYGLSECESNLQILMKYDGTIVRPTHDKNPVLWVSGNDGAEIPLVTATAEELQAREQKKVDDYQAKLIEMRDSNDLQGLRAAAKAEYEELHSSQNTATAYQKKVYEELRKQYAADSQRGFWESLPEEFTKKVIYTWNGEKMRKMVGRYGASRITARINELSSIPDGNGGTINFEEKR